jgi:predicted DNA binding CopG/RHH family protein
MKKRLPPAKVPLPKFRSDEEMAEYFGTHSIADIRDKLPEVRPDRLSKALTKSVRERHDAAKTPVSIRLGIGQIVAAKKIAAAKSVGYQTQLRVWIAEGIRREATRR